MIGAKHTDIQSEKSVTPYTLVRDAARSRTTLFTPT